MKPIYAIICLPLALLLSLQGNTHPGAHESLQHFSQQIARYPQQQGPYIQRGIVYSNDGQYALALADFQTAAALGDPALVGFDLGVLYYRMGDVVTARRYFDAFLRQYPNHAACLEYRARMARDSGDYETALADFKRVFELQARPNPGHYISAAQMLGSTSDQGVDAALALLDQGMARLGTIPQLQRFAIELESARGNYQAALERLQSLQATEGSSPKWCADMGELLATMKRPQESQHWYLEAARQLQTQRKTPATLALQAQIQAALAALD